MKNLMRFKLTLYFSKNVALLLFSLRAFVRCSFLTYAHYLGLEKLLFIVLLPLNHSSFNFLLSDFFRA